MTLNTYVALLRGINVSGKNKIKMAELKEHLTEWGLIDVQTYIQSGNLVFRSSEQDPSALVTSIQNGIQQTYGYDVDVKVFSAPDFLQACQESPYASKKGIDIAHLHLTFLEAAPTSQQLESLQTRAKGEEAFEVKGNRIYLYCPHGYGRTKLSNNDIERVCKQSATTRNWKTMMQLQEMLTS
jgi:uncharacterized protein (DUF1697 family)